MVGGRRSARVDDVGLVDEALHDGAERGRLVGVRVRVRARVRARARARARARVRVGRLGVHVAEGEAGGPRGRRSVAGLPEKG